MVRGENRKAFQQLMALGVLAALVAGLARWASIQPDRDADLRVLTEELEAEAAELEAFRGTDLQDVPVEFRSRHELQLARDFERTSHELVSLHVIPRLRSRQARIASATRELEPIFRQSTTAGAPDTRPRLRALRRELHAQAAGLTR